MRVDHIGYAVRDIDKARKTMEVLGYSFKSVIEDKDRNIFIAFGELDGYCIELVSPLGDGTPVDSILTKNGPMPYHICYRSSDIESDIAMLSESKFRVVIPLAPAVAFGGKRVVFLYSLSIGLVEIVEE